jgi:hypothetical protein
MEGIFLRGKHNMKGLLKPRCLQEVVAKTREMCLPSALQVKITVALGVGNSVVPQRYEPADGEQSRQLVGGGRGVAERAFLPCNIHRNYIYRGGLRELGERSSLWVDESSVHDLKDWILFYGATSSQLHDGRQYILHPMIELLPTEHDEGERARNGFREDHFSTQRLITVNTIFTIYRWEPPSPTFL